MEENRLLRYFKWDHLPAHLQLVSRPFGELANQISELSVSDAAEQTVALRKLLEAKDAAVRAMIPQE